MNHTVLDDLKPVIIGAVITMNITLNVLVITVIAKYPQLREDRTTLFMLSLTLSDLANGCTAMPISAAVCSSATPTVRSMMYTLPRILQVCSVWFNFTSMHSLCWVTVCKMIAITKPLRYEQLLTSSRCYLIITCIWLSGACLATLGTRFITNLNADTCTYDVPHVEDIKLYLLLGIVTGLLLPVSVLVYATTKIFCVIVRTHRQIAAQVNSMSGPVGNTPSLTLKSIRSGINVLLICLAFVILTFPLVVYTVVAALTWNRHLPSSYRFFAVWIFMCNSSGNSFIYLLVFHSVRSKTADMLANVCRVCHLC